MILRNYLLKLFIDHWFRNEESTDKQESVDLSDMPPLEGD